MSARHHIGDDLLMGYAAGTLDEASSLLVATHLALCPSCRARADRAEMIGGELLDALPPTEISRELIDLTLARLPEQAVAPQSAPSIRVRSDILIPEPLRSYLGGDVDALRWSRVAPRVQQIVIDIPGSGPRARMLRFQAGTQVPAHGHGGRELTLVLCGSLHDGDAVLRRGDVAQTDETTEHQPHAGPERDCVCLAVTDAPLRFKGALAWLLQPWFGI